MARPSKPVLVLENEKKSHRTKADLQKRKEEEAKLLSGMEMKERKEVRENKEAHKEFTRLKKLMKNIEKNDALYETVINRYAMLLAECMDFEEKRESFYKDLQELTEHMDEIVTETSLSEYHKLKNTMQKNILDIDRQVQAKRKMLLEIEKENVMTIAASLRSIPKKEDKADDPLLKVLKGG